MSRNPESVYQSMCPAPGGDPDTGDMNGAARWLWLVIMSAVVMTGYARGFERRKQR